MQTRLLVEIWITRLPFSGALKLGNGGTSVFDSFHFQLPHFWCMCVRVLVSSVSLKIEIVMFSSFGSFYAWASSTLKPNSRGVVFLGGNINSSRKLETFLGRVGGLYLHFLILNTYLYCI